MTKVYIVTRVGWEYNDENYLRAETGGTDLTDMKAFRSYHNAKDFCDAKNLEAFKKFASDIGSYEEFHETLEEMINPTLEEDFQYVCKVHNIDPKTSVEHFWGEPDADFHHFSTLTDEQLKAVIPFLTFANYEVSEVEIEDES